MADVHGGYNFFIETWHLFIFDNETRFQLLLSKGRKYNHYNTKHIGSKKKSTRLQTTIVLLTSNYSKRCCKKNYNKRKKSRMWKPPWWPTNNLHPFLWFSRRFFYCDITYVMDLNMHKGEISLFLTWHM